MNTIRAINVSFEISGALISFLIIIFLVLSRRNHIRQDRIFLYYLIINVIVLLSDALARIFSGKLDMYGLYIVPMAIFFIFAGGYLLLVAFTEYIMSLLAARGCKVNKYFKYGIRVGAIIFIFLLILSQFNHMYYLIDEANLYRRQPLFWLSQVFGVIGAVLDMLLIILYKESLSKGEWLLFAFYIITPGIGLILQECFYDIGFLYIGTNIVAICIYMFIQVEQSRRIIESELELERNKTLLMLSQIKPHFLYNVLGSIKYLCHVDPVSAEMAVEDLSIFLRGNIDSLSYRGLISFKRELLHTRKYLSLEKIRYENLLNIEYSIKTVDFQLPPLTLQPIVENAVRYGVTQREEGGTIKISSEETEEAFIICVEDDGVGFDTHVYKRDERMHTGIENVKQRIEVQCRGTMIIKSTIDVGTRVVIEIPKKTSTK